MNSSRVISPDAIANSRWRVLAEPADIAFDRDVVGRVGEDHLGLLPIHQSFDHVRIERVAAIQAGAARAARRRQAGSVTGTLSGSGSRSSAGSARLLRREALDETDRPRRSRSR